MPPLITSVEAERCLHRLLAVEWFELSEERLHGQAGVDICGRRGDEMHPAASVRGFYFSHPESRYFAVGKSRVIRFWLTNGVKAWIFAQGGALAGAPNLN